MARHLAAVGRVAALALGVPGGLQPSDSPGGVLQNLCGVGAEDVVRGVGGRSVGSTVCEGITLDPLGEGGGGGELWAGRGN